MNKHQHLTLVNTSETSLLNTTQTVVASMTQTPTSQVILPLNINKERVALKVKRLKERTQDTSHIKSFQLAAFQKS